jgi:hypothetical protein
VHGSASPSRRRVRATLTVAALLLCLAPPPAVQATTGEATPGQAGTSTAAVPAPGPEDVVVVAVIDYRVSPYHLDFTAAGMPQHLDDDTGNDLPLDRPPHEWLPGFPEPSAFADYAPLGISVPRDGADVPAELRNRDMDLWTSVPRSTPSQTAYRWLPGTKVIGAVTFGMQGLVDPVQDPNGTTGTKQASLAAGNVYGVCPECLIVFVGEDWPTEEGHPGDLERAAAWARSQPWIDVVVDGHGYAYTEQRTNVWTRGDLDLARDASERGQVFVATATDGAGDHSNSLRPGVPTSTYTSSRSGPDWLITVGASTYSGDDHSGVGKPVDVAANGSWNPVAAGVRADGRSNWGGPWAATPIVGGIVGSALSWARARLPGPSRIQDDGVVATGSPVVCEPASASCELDDGVLTARELRTRVLHGTLPTSNGLGGGAVSTDVRTRETELATEGHGTFRGRSTGPLTPPGPWDAERQYVVGPMDGSTRPLERPAGEHEWMVADSYCRQQLWGTWSDGAWDSASGPPAPSPTAPVPTAFAVCAGLFEAGRSLPPIG